MRQWLLFHICLLAVAAAAGAAAAEEGPDARPKYPTFDGSQNNKDHPTWGQTFTPYSRVQVPQVAYVDGDAMTGANRPSPRFITLALLNQPYFKATSAFNSSYLLTGLGQLIAHDITRGGSTPQSNGGPAPIKVPDRDPYMWSFKNQTPVRQNSRLTLPYTRTNYTRLTKNGHRQQVNQASAWIDASSFYGETDAIAKLLRTEVAGRLKDDGNRMLPLNLEERTGQPRFTMKNTGERLPQTRLRFSGNLNINQNPLLLSLATVLMREHNRRAIKIEAEHPDYSGDKVFNEARKWVVAHWQRITLVDYLAALGIALTPYKGYDSSLDPSIDNFFSTVAYRYGHSTVGDVIMRLGKDWSIHPKGHLTLARAYYNPEVALEAGLDPLIRGLIAQPQGKVEPRWSLSVAGGLFGESTVNGTDLAAINIQRGRDHGIPDYNTCRRAFGLPRIETFQDLTKDTLIASKLRQLYGNVDNIDAYVGGLAEKPEGGSHVGPLFTASIREQFTRLRDADWWYYENGLKNGLFNQSEIEEIRATDLRKIIERNTDIKDLPEDIWTASTTMSCSAGAAPSGSSSGTSGTGRFPTASPKLRMPSLMGGAASLLVEPSRPGWVKVILSSAGAGWLGFAVADPDSGTPMIGSDMVIGRMVNGVPKVSRFNAREHQPPTELPADAQDGRLSDVVFEQSRGQVRLEFQRPTQGDKQAPNRAMPVNSKMRLLVARGPTNDVSTLLGYHGAGPYRDIIDLKEGLFGTASTMAADEQAVHRRMIHGVLMALNFVVIFPLGALAARQLRSHWIKSHVLKASMFYLHILVQLVGIALATAGFVLATKWFAVPYNTVEFHHGKLGIAVLALVYSQLVLGFMRPSASHSKWRNTWDILHSTLGHAAIVVGIANVGVGVVIFAQLYGANFSIWAAACATALGVISLLQFVLDRKEKYAVTELDKKLLMAQHVHAAEPAENGKAVPPEDFGDPHSAHGGLSYQDDQLSASAAGISAGPTGSGYAKSPTLRGRPAGGPKLTATLLQQHEANAEGDLTSVEHTEHDTHPHGFGPPVNGAMGHTATDAHHRVWDQNHAGMPTSPASPPMHAAGPPPPPAAAAGLHPSNLPFMNGGYGQMPPPKGASPH